VIRTRRADRSGRPAGDPARRSIAVIARGHVFRLELEAAHDLVQHGLRIAAKGLCEALDQQNRGHEDDPVLEAARSTGEVEHAVRDARRAADIAMLDRDVQLALSVASSASTPRADAAVSNRCCLKFHGHAFPFRCTPARFSDEDAGDLSGIDVAARVDPSRRAGRDLQMTEKKPPSRAVFARGVAGRVVGWRGVA
jgi:hypothetical protein